MGGRGQEVRKEGQVQDTEEQKKERRKDVEEGGEGWMQVRNEWCGQAVVEVCNVVRKNKEKEAWSAWQSHRG